MRYTLSHSKVKAILRRKDSSSNNEGKWSFQQRTFIGPKYYKICIIAQISKRTKLAASDCAYLPFSSNDRTTIDNFSATEQLEK